MCPVIRGIYANQNPGVRVVTQEALQVIPGLFLEVFLYGIFQVDDDPVRAGGDGFGDALWTRGRDKQGSADNRWIHGVSPWLNSTSPICAVPS